MDWIVQIGDSCVETLIRLVPLGIALGLLASLMPCNRGMHWWNDLRAAGTDLLYWFVLPLAVRVCRTLILWAGVARVFGDGTPGFETIRAWPIWVQCVVVLLMQDMILYWVHRAFHTRLAWRFHAVHHSPKVLDWVSAARFHLVNHLFSFVLADVVALLMGFSPAALVALVPFNMVYSAMVHANLNWTFGRCGLSSPARCFIAGTMWPRETEPTRTLPRRFRFSTCCSAPSTCLQANCRGISATAKTTFRKIFGGSLSTRSGRRLRKGTLLSLNRYAKRPDLEQ